MPVKNHRLLFYGLLFALGLMQALLTELHDDEAYYWVYSRFPDWGYFDHPPLLAWLIRAGYWLFPNELGVRLFTLLLHIGTVYLVERLIRPKNPALFYTIILSVAAIQLMGFAAVPDIPLLFFTALFFVCYKNFLQTPTLRQSLCLGVVAALMLYSKYHAVLVLLATLLSNPRLFRNYLTYIAGGTAFLLFLPHLYWQYQHDWISFRYQLLESNVNPYRISFSLDYLLSQFLLAGPLAGWWLLPAAWLYRPQNGSERAMKFTLVIIYLFFLASSFRGKVEANWTLPAFISLFVLSYRYIENKNGWKKWLRLQLPLSLLLVMLARIVMIADVLPLRFLKEHYHAWNKWPALMKERTRGLPIVFSSSYQRASKYWFYTGQPAFSLNHYKDRSNNYDTWKLEESLLGKPVYFLDKYDLYRFPDSLPSNLGYIGYRYDSSWASFSGIRILFGQNSLSVKKGDSLHIDCRVQLPPAYASFLQSHPGLPTHTRIAVFNKYRWIKDIPLPATVYSLAAQPVFSLSLNPDLPKGNYRLLFSIQHDPYSPTHNSRKIGLRVQ